MPPIEEPVTALSGRFAENPGGDADLRMRTGRGTLINALFLVLTSGLGLLRGIVVAAILTTTTYGEWGMLLAAFTTLIALGSVGVDDKYIQQDDPDQQRAFEVAFTLQAIIGLIFVVVILVGMPLFGALYDRPSIVGPGLLFAAAMPALALQMPLWVHYRRMDFLRQRLLQIIDPVVTLVATVGLALAGLGLWALVVGALAGTYCATVAIVLSSPYRLRLRWDRTAVREYTSFSWPLLVGSLVAIVLVQVPVVVSARELGVAAVAGIALATTITQFAHHVDDVVTQTLYPAICAVKDRPDLLFESFWKSNRLALLWAAPIGAAAALFASDFVTHVLGEKWRFAVPLVALFGVNAALNQIGFNWMAFYRAIGNTRPQAVSAGVGLVSVLAIAVPLLAVYGLTAFGVGMGVATLIGVAVRLWYLKRLFPGLALLPHVVRGIGPTLPAVAAVLAVRAIEGGGRPVARVAAEAVLFTVVVVAATWLSERPLLRESLGYLRRASPLAGAAA